MTEHEEPAARLLAALVASSATDLTHTMNALLGVERERATRLGIALVRLYDYLDSQPGDVRTAADDAVLAAVWDDVQEVRDGIAGGWYDLPGEMATRPGG